MIEARMQGVGVIRTFKTWYLARLWLARQPIKTIFTLKEVSDNDK